MNITYVVFITFNKLPLPLHSEIKLWIRPYTVTHVYTRLSFTCILTFNMIHSNKSYMHNCVSNKLSDDSKIVFFFFPV